jgi:hypothetical protein
VETTCSGCGETKSPEGFYWKPNGALRYRLCKACWHERYYKPRRQELIDKNVERKRKVANRPGLRKLECQQCGNSYESYAKRSRFCSYECKDRARKDAAIAARLAAKPERVCRHCGVSLLPTMRADAAFCSEDCNSAAHQVTRKMRKRGNDPDLTLVSRQQIAERDRWRCGICGGLVKKDLKYPEPMAPSIDHMVPLSKGGDNSPANLQLAHLRCNIVKRDKGSQQLRII